MDDPSRREPPQPYPPPQPHVVQGLPGMPPVHLPGVGVVVSNVVAPYPLPPPPPYSAPPAIEPLRAEAPFVAGAPLAPAARRRRAQMIGVGLVAAMIPYCILLVLAGFSPGLVVIAELPLALTAAIMFRAAARTKDDDHDPALEQAILRVASEHQGVVRVGILAQSSGRSLRDCQRAIDAMVSSGHATVDADDRGGLVYRLPDFADAPKRLGAGS